MPGYPGLITPINHVEPVPRRVRGYLNGHVLFDTDQALYVWEFPPYPQFYIPRAAVDEALLVDEERTQHTKRGKVQVYGLTGAEGVRDAAARLYVESDVEAIVEHFRFEWPALDAWFEEDEEVFVHPRNPFTRTDVLRSSKRVRIELDGVVLAESTSPLILFETGLPPRYYLNRTDVNWEHLVASDTETQCPYKGTTSDYWTAEIAGSTYADLAWSYDFPARDVLPIKNQVAFFDEKVDVFVDDVLQDRPQTPFS